MMRWEYKGNPFYSARLLSGRLISKSAFLRQKGFTLLEVMVALAVFALAASMLILSDGNSIRQTRYQQEKILASQIADHYLNVLHAEGRWSGPAVRPQIESYAGYQWYVRETSVAVDSPDFRKVQVEVFIGESEPEKGAAPLARLSTWLRRPGQK